MTTPIGQPVGLGSGQNRTLALEKSFSFEKSSGRLFSVQETISQLRVSIKFPLLGGQYGEEIRDVTEFRFYFY
jgi:hypothetical protein